MMQGQPTKTIVSLTQSRKEITVKEKSVFYFFWFQVQKWNKKKKEKKNTQTFLPQKDELQGLK